MLSATATQNLAISVVALVYLAILVAALILLRRSPQTPLQSVLLGWNTLMGRIWWRARIEGRLEIPPGVGAVVVCNHHSPMDPGFVAMATDRNVHWMVAKEYCLHPCLAWIFRTFQAIPVGRGGFDTAATKAAIRYASAGGVVGMFPEGRINTTSRLLLAGRPGAALIALKARAVVIPCHISGSPFQGSVYSCFLLRARTCLKVGNALDLSEFYGREHQREVVEEVTRRMLREIARLGGDPNYPVELAGRFYRPQRP